jgi:hypothetical protein
VIVCDDVSCSGPETILSSIRLLYAMNGFELAYRIRPLSRLFYFIGDMMDALNAAVEWVVNVCAVYLFFISPEGVVCKYTGYRERDFN